MSAVTFTVNVTVALTPHRPLNVEAYNEACERFQVAVNQELDATVEDYADLGDWVVTVEGTQ